MPFGLGKPTSGKYDTTGTLGYKAFGGQGQGTDPKGWKQPDSPKCTNRYMMVLAMSKYPAVSEAKLEVEFGSDLFHDIPSATIITKVAQAA